MKAKHAVIAAVLAVTLIGGACGSNKSGLQFTATGRPAAAEITTTTVAPATTTVAPTTTEAPTTTVDTISPENHEAPGFLAAIRDGAPYLFDLTDTDLVEAAAKTCASLIVGERTYMEMAQRFATADDNAPGSDGAFVFLFVTSVKFFCPDQAES